ncbi:MAG: bacillithiol biosynthesis cysteine-adding enzyme BshC [Bacteroidetes bacterium]|nr:MAG: bacillithiol biosynthesis cysteine-adding enzyme BshC [Bacteroidota bacterium]
MQLLPIAAENSGLYSKLALDFIAQKPEIKPFIANWPDKSGFTNQIASRTFSAENRKVLHQALVQQYAGLALPEITQTQLDSLLDEQTFTVTTGQQIHIFLGPMYVYWKIVSAIGLSRKLKQDFPDKHFVPVFWMATEDHDFAEVNHLEIFNNNLVWDHDPAFGGPVGHRSTEGLPALSTELDELFSRQEGWKEFSAMFSEAYSGNKNFAQATRELVHKLFAQEGLLILDPDDVQLKELFRPIVLDELKEGKSFGAVEAQSAELEKSYSRQLNPREINLFYFDGTLRDRIVKEGNQYKTAEGIALCDTASLDTFVAENLEAISPNVVLRPVYQEVILPNLAYIGGPGEIAYWLQLKGVFDTYQVPFPILENRKSVFVVNPKQAENLEKMGIGIADLFKDEAELEALIFSQSGKELSDLQSELNSIAELKDASIGKVASFLPKWAKPLAESFNQLEKNLKKAESDILADQRQQEEKKLDKVFKAKKSLIDKGFTQERNQYVPQYLLQLKGAEICAEIGQNYDGVGAVFVLIA